MSCRAVPPKGVLQKIREYKCFDLQNPPDNVVFRKEKEEIYINDKSTLAKLKNETVDDFEQGTTLDWSIKRAYDGRGGWIPCNCDSENADGTLTFTSKQEAIEETIRRNTSETFVIEQKDLVVGFKGDNEKLACFFIGASRAEADEGWVLFHDAPVMVNVNDISYNYSECMIVEDKRILSRVTYSTGIEQTWPEYTCFNLIDLPNNVTILDTLLEHDLEKEKEEQLELPFENKNVETKSINQEDKNFYSEEESFDSDSPTKENYGCTSIYHNPFRVLGLPITATDREIAKRISDLTIYMEMGKTKEFDFDQFFPIRPNRTKESIYDASQKIEQPDNKLFYSLFWFWENSANTIDEMAFEELKNGNVDKAIQFWEKATNNSITTQNSSNLKNLAVLFLGLSFKNGDLDRTQFLKSINLSGNFYSSCDFEEFINLLIGHKHSIDPQEIIGSYVDEIISLARPHLDTSNGLKTKELIKSFSSYPEEVQNSILDKFIGKYILNIERQIEIAESRCEENASEANIAGFEIYEKTKEDLNYLKTILSESDFEFQLVADKLADQIIDCSICYFNKFRDSEPDPGDDALELAQYAKQIAVGERINQRIDEGMPILQEYVDDKPQRNKLKPVKREIDCIYKEIKKLQSIDSVSHYSYPSVAKTFLLNCEIRLDVIKNTLGHTDSDYLEICDLVAGNAIGISTAYLNTMATASDALSGDKKRLYLKDALASIRPMLETIGHLDMPPLTRKRYDELCTNLGLKPTSAKPSSSKRSHELSTKEDLKQSSESTGGCYIATMVYGSYNAPEVMVLRRFRDEVLQQSAIGRKLVQVYYKYSPSFVKKTKNLKRMHIVFKTILYPLVNYLKAKDE